MAAKIDQRGRRAHAPADIGAKGWKDIFWRIWNGFFEDRVMLVAAAVAFFALLAFVPSIAALFALYGLVFDPENVLDQVSAVSGFMPSEAHSLLEEQLKRLVAEPAANLGFAFVVSLLISLWSASSAVRSLFDGLNIVYGEDEKRSLAAYYGTALAFTLAGLLAVIGMIAVTVALPLVLAFIFPVADKAPIDGISYGFLVVFFWLALTALYRWGPSRTEAKWRWLAPGSLVATLAITGFSAAFSWYAQTFAAYSAYGSLGAIICFMTWLWICVLFVLLGAEINAESEHHTARESKTGPPLAMGQQRAVVADTIGARFVPVALDAKPLTNLPKAGLADSNTAFPAAFVLTMAVVVIVLSLRAS